MATTHTMGLGALPFALIKNGSKTIELRLYDEKRRFIQIGDKIRFTPSSGAADFVLTEVTDLLRYSSFADMIDDLPLEWFGGTDKDALKKGIYDYYTVEDERKDGVLGIRIRHAE